MILTRHRIDKDADTFFDPCAWGNFNQKRVAEILSQLMEASQQCCFFYYQYQ
jgi:hypothetical protein